VTIERVRLAAGWISMLLFVTSGMMICTDVLQGVWSLVVLFGAVAVYAFVTFLFPEAPSSVRARVQPERSSGSGSHEGLSFTIGRPNPTVTRYTASPR